MAKTKEDKKKKSGKKVLNKNIQEKLAGALADFREVLGEKEFTTRIKKASKLFSRGVKIQKKEERRQEKTTVKELKPFVQEQAVGKE